MSINGAITNLSQEAEASSMEEHIKKILLIFYYS
jgi:hypothetical protein